MSNDSGSHSRPPTRESSGRYAAASTSGYFAAVAGSSQLPAAPHDQAAVLVMAHLNSLLRSWGMYDANHPQHLAQANRFGTAISPAFDNLGVQTLQFVFVGQHIYVGGRPVRPNERVVEKTTAVLDLMLTVGVTELRLSAGTQAQDIKQLVEGLLAARESGHPLPRDIVTPTVQALVPRQSDEHAELLAHLRFSNRFELLQLYGEALSTVRRWAHDIQGGGVTDSIAANRLAIRLIDAYAADPSGLVGLVNLRPIAGSFANRRLDATIIAIAIARELGFNDAHTVELAATNLVRRLPDDWKAWWARQPQPPYTAASNALRAETSAEAIASFEAGAPVGLAIPPEYYGRNVQPHAITQLLSVASGYVDLLQPGEASNPFAPEAAVQMMIAQSGSFFEPTVVAALVQALGVWPPGSAVRLNSGDVAVVVHRPRPGARSNRPFIRPVEFNNQVATYDLSRPELDAYRIVGSAQRGDSPVNPMYVFIQ